MGQPLPGSWPMFLFGKECVCGFQHPVDICIGVGIGEEDGFKLGGGEVEAVA